MTSAGAVALQAWMRQHGAVGSRALWQRCGWGPTTVDAIIAGLVVPSEEMAEHLALVTAGAVTVDMFSVPA